MAMTERHDESAGSGRRMSTGEFRAAPDISASTAQFRAFAEEGADSAISAPSRSPARLAILIGAVIVVLAIIAILGATLG
jgi:hypothetical protein